MVSSISIHDTALQRCAMRFSEPINAPEFAAQEPHGSDEFVLNTLRGIFKSDLEMPFYFEPHNILLSPTLIPSLVSDLVSWLESTISMLQSPTIFQRVAFKGEYLLSLVRALGYVYGNDKVRFSKDCSLYLNLHNALAAISIHRYCFGVLQKLALDIKFEVSRRASSIRDLAIGLFKMVAGWVSFMEANVPSLLKVSFHYLQHTL